MGIFSHVISQFTKTLNPANLKKDPTAFYDPDHYVSKDPDNMMPAPTEAPATPDTDPAAIAARDAAQLRERQDQLRARGASSTILSGAQGDTSKPNLAKRYLLGA